MTSPPIPRVSILLPCRDAEAHLEDCIASLAAQTESRYEVLVLDDGSSDGTLERLARWVERDPRVRPVETERRGIVPALNAMAAAARAPILARMDADDVARPRRLSSQLDLLDASLDVVACGTGVRYFPRDRMRSGYRRYEAWLNGLTGWEAIERDLFVECPIAHPTLMIRRRILKELGGYREFDGPEDYDLILRMVRAGHRLASVPEVLLEWRLGSNRLSEASMRYSAGAFRRLKIEHLREWVVSESRLAGRELVVWGAGKVGKAFVRDWLATGGAPFAALIDLDPRKIGQEIHGSPVVHPGDLAVRFVEHETSPFVLVAVGSPGAREEIREALEEMGAKDLEDYRVVA
jgi:glycosyltransferase involved in cell wall biosynthesis